MIIDEDLAELFGMHIGDGCMSITKKYYEYYLGGDLKEEKEYHDNWVKPLFNKKIMVPLFNKEVERLKISRTRRERTFLRGLTFC